MKTNSSSILGPHLVTSCHPPSFWILKISVMWLTDAVIRSTMGLWQQLQMFHQSATGVLRDCISCCRGNSPQAFMTSSWKDAHRIALASRRRGTTAEFTMIVACLHGIVEDDEYVRAVSMHFVTFFRSFESVASHHGMSESVLNPSHECHMKVKTTKFRAI